MTNRTIQVHGQVTNDGNPSTGLITATLNGNIVFSGSVPTADPSILFSFDVDMALDGSIPMSCNIQNCDVVFGQMLVNYCLEGYTGEPPVPVSSGPNGFLDTSPGVDSRANVTCTGAAYCSPPPPTPRPDGADGTWSWSVDTNPDTTATFSYNLQIVAGTE